jgi:hypothetical protein
MFGVKYVLLFVNKFEAANAANAKTAAEGDLSLAAFEALLRPNQQ